MKIFLKSKFYLLIIFLNFVSLAKAQWDCEAGDCGGGSSNPNPPSQGSGSQATPIDEYTIYLIGIAVFIAVAYFTVKKFKKSLI